jgi:hypothetical protein
MKTNFRYVTQNNLLILTLLNGAVSATQPTEHEQLTQSQRYGRSVATCCVRTIRRLADGAVTSKLTTKKLRSSQLAYRPTDQRIAF